MLITGNFEIYEELSECDKEMKANAIGEMALRDLFNVGLPQPSICKKCCISVNYNKVKHDKIGMPICCCSVTKLCLILCNPIDCSTPGFPVLHYLPEFVKTLSIELVMPSNHLIFCCSFLLLPSIFPSIRVFSNNLALPIRGPKYWSFSISPSSEYSGLISFRIDWLDLPAVEGTLKSLLQHDSLKASILRCSAFFRVLLSHSYMTSTLLPRIVPVLLCSQSFPIR